MTTANWLKKPAYEQVQEFVADASLAIDIGDLMYLDTDDAKPASSQADQLTEAANQELFASKFIGVAVSARLSTDDAAGVVSVQCDGLYEFTCTSSTFEIGAMVGADEASNGTSLEDQSVKAVTDASLAIGVVVQRYASATTKVWCRLINRVSWDLAHKVGGAQDITVLDFTGATGVNEIQVPTNLADALSIEDSAGDLIVVDTTTGSQRVTVTPAVTISEDLTLAKAIVFNGATGINEIRVSANKADALSIEDATGDIITVDTTTGAIKVTVAAGELITNDVTVGAGDTLAVTDVDQVTVNGVIVPQCMEISVAIELHATRTEMNLFVAREAWQVTHIDYTPHVAQGGALTATVVKAVGTATPANGTTPMHTANAIDLNATIHTVQPITLTVTTADLQLAAGNRIGLDLSGAMTAGSGLLTIRMKRI